MESKINLSLRDKRLKIAFLSFYSGDVYRGVETYVHELSNRLVDLGMDVTVYQHGKKIHDSKYKTVTSDVFIDWNKKSSHIQFLDYYAGKVRKFTNQVLNQIDKEIDIVIPTNGQWQSVLSSIWVKKNKKIIIIPGQSGPGIDDRINLWTFPNRFIALTEYQKSWAQKVNPSVKSVVIPNGVDLSKFKDDAKPLKLDMTNPIVLCVGAFDYWKRQDLAIKAVSKTNMSLLLVGKGEKEKELSELGNKLLPGRFKIMSFPHSEMPKVYAACDLFTYPTVPWESFGIVMVEAMASGLSVVATDDPIRREIVGEAGLFVDPTNIDNYAETLDKALKINWSKKPRQQAEKFSWDDISERYRKLFEELI